jgi:hypothetical protein
MGQACSRCNEFLNVGDKNHCQQCTRELLEELDAIPRSELPRLLRRFKLPFSRKWFGPSDNRIVDAKGYAFCEGLSDEEAGWLLALLTAVYPKPINQGDKLDGYSSHN